MAEPAVPGRVDVPVPARVRVSRDRLSERLAIWLSGLKRSTRLKYEQILHEWCLFLGAESPASSARLMLAATELEAARYREWLYTRPGYRGNHGNATIAGKMAILRKAYRIISSLTDKSNPFDPILVPPPSKHANLKRPTEMIPFESVRAIRDLPDVSTPKGVRDHAILALLFGGGLRRGELSKLSISDVKRSPKGAIYVVLRGTKNGRDYHQALPPWAGDSVERLVSQRLAESATPASPLCNSYVGRGGLISIEKPISSSGIYKLFLGYAEQVGITGRTPHSARATAITKLLADGVPYRNVQEFSRHASVQMVELYDKRRLSVDESPAQGLDF